jgi:hypothetical protein
MTDDADRVAAWLRDHPSFLADRPDLYAALQPPRRVHGEGLADHMAAMIAAERRRASVLTEELAEAITAGRADARLGSRCRNAVLALMAAADPVECALQEWPALLGVEHVTLAAEGAPPPPLTPLPPGTIDRLLPKRQEVALRTTPTEAPLLHAEASKLVARDALIRIGLHRPLLLALGAREAATLPRRGSGPHLVFLGKALAAALMR